MDLQTPDRTTAYVCPPLGNGVTEKSDSKGGPIRGDASGTRFWKSWAPNDVLISISRSCLPGHRSQLRESVTALNSGARETGAIKTRQG